MMLGPKPVSLTQISEEEYEGFLDPERLVVVGPIPGGGGGGGAVDSVNGKTGVVSLNLDDVVGNQGATDGVIEVTNSLTNPTQSAVIQSASVTLQDTATSGNTSLYPGGLYLSTAGNNRARLSGPNDGGLDTEVTLPSRSGILALANLLPTINTGDATTPEETTALVNELKATVNALILSLNP